MAYQFDPRQQLDIQVPASAMESQLGRGASLTKGIWDYQQEERRRALQKLLAEQELKQRQKEWEEKKKLQEEQADEDFWSSIIGTGISIIPGIGNLFK